MASHRAQRALAAVLLTLFARPSQAHIEDVCVRPGGVRNFYRHTSALGCRYAPAGLRGTLCTVALLLENTLDGQFRYNSSCRGIVHFDSVYFMAASLGFKQEIAYWLAAFSQAVDFSEFVMFDSCGRAMDEAWWTPTMKGFVRTLFSAGGFNMHIGAPLVGEQAAGRCKPHAEGGVYLKCPPLHQSEKKVEHWPRKQDLARDTGCLVRGNTREEYQVISQVCPALNYTLDDGVFYDGPLAAWKRWAFNRTQVLCNGGYTKFGPGGNPTTGSACPSGGVQYFGDLSKKVTTLIPVNGFLTLGEQIIDYDCMPSCACYQNCSNRRDNHDFKMVNEKRVRATRRGSTFGLYLEEACSRQGRACMLQGGPVPELVARLGILLHYYTDRASHWYCTDAPGSGVMVQRAMNKDYEYDLVLYLQPDTCAVTMHADTHYWEQGMGMDDAYLAPGTTAALYQMYDVLAEFADEFRSLHADWFDGKVKPMGPMKAIGTREQPGFLYNIVRHRAGAKRVKAHMEALKASGLPPLPGWEKECGVHERGELPVKKFGAALAQQLGQRPGDCGLKALLHFQGRLFSESEALEAAAARIAREVDGDGDGWLSGSEVERWENDFAVLSAYEKCAGKVVHI